MIASLRGELVRVEADYIVIDVNGVGYKVLPPLAVITQMPQIGDEVRLMISTIVKEDSITLYGFMDDIGQSLFELLLTVTGVGPKMALSILSELSVDGIISAISSDRFIDLKRVSGVGTKTAQRIVLELREKMTTLAWAQQTARVAATPEQRSSDDAVEGLIALGYNRNDARSAVEEAMKSVKDSRDTGAIVRVALGLLAKG